MSEVDKFSRGIVKDRNRLYWEDFKQMRTPRPPSNEHIRIADVVDRIAELTCVGIRNLRCQFNLANEHRTRFIADVVTGKLDLRKATSELPDSNSGADGGGWKRDRSNRIRSTVSQQHVRTGGNPMTH